MSYFQNQDVTKFSCAIDRCTWSSSPPSFAVEGKYSDQAPYDLECQAKGLAVTFIGAREKDGGLQVWWHGCAWGGGQFPVSESTCFAQSCTPRQTRSLPSGNVRQRQSSTPQDRGAWSTGTANSKQGMGPIAPSSKHCKLVEDQPHAECIALSLSGQPIRSLKGRWRHATDGDKTGLFELLHVGQALDPQDVCLCATELIAWFFYF